MWFYVLLAVGIFTVVFVPIIACIVLAMLVVYLIFDDKFIKTHPVQCKIAKKEFLRSARDMVRIGEVLVFSFEKENYRLVVEIFDEQAFVTVKKSFFDSVNSGDKVTAMIGKGRFSKRLIVGKIII